MSIDYTKLKASDLRDDLIKNYGLSEEEVTSVKGKKDLVSLHQKTLEQKTEDVLQETVDEWQAQLDSLVDNIDNINDAVSLEQPQEENNESVPHYNSPEWPDFVMSKFTEEELDKNGHPLITGLRRVAELLLGEVISSGPVHVYPSTDTNGLGRAVVVFEVVFAWSNGLSVSLDLLSQDMPEKVFRAIGSSSINNTNADFAVFPESMAETRAEARVYRRALKLRKVAADELTNLNTTEIVEDYRDKQGGLSGEKITEAQLTVMKLSCDRLGIDFTKFINSGVRTYSDPQDIPKESASRMMQRLNEYQSKGSGSVEIPIELKKENGNDSVSPVE